MLKKKHLLKVQKRIKKNIIKNKRVAIWADMGLGKTVSSLTAAEELNAFPLLIIAPPNVAKNVWHTEVAKWKHLRHLTCSVVIGTVKQREKRLAEDVDIYIISSGSIKWFAQTWNQKSRKYKMLIIDEAGQYRGYNTVRSVIVRQLGRYIKRCVELTASPMPNGEGDLWSQFAILDNGKRLGKAWRDYVSRYLEENKYNHTFKVRGKQEKEEITKAISDITFVYKAENYLDMPELIKSTTMVSLNSKKMKDYLKLQIDYLLEVEEGQIDVVNSLVMSGKLQQYANGTVRQKTEVQDDDEKIIEGEEIYDIHNEKLNMLKEMCGVDVMGNENVLIAYSHRADRKKILDAIPGIEMFKGQEIMYNHWNDNRSTGLRYLCHPQSVGHGLNLQEGGATILFYGMPRSYELYEQLIGRLWRQGQSGSVTVHHLITQDTIDEDIYQILQMKGNFQENLKKRVVELSRLIR